MKKQVIFITGTSSGLGKAIAELCYENGHIVYGSSRNPPAENPTFKELKVDVTDQQSVQHAIKHILEKEGRIDVVINNAGLGIIGPVEYLDVADVNKVWLTNVNGLLHVLQAVLPSMRHQNAGKIVSISSIASVIALPFRGVYCASKSAGDKIIQSLRMELSQTNISCCSIQAGDIKTSINENRLKVKDLEDPFYADIVKRTNHHIDEEVNKEWKRMQKEGAVDPFMNKEKLREKMAKGKVVDDEQKKANVTLESIFRVLQRLATA